ncbi:NAD(P)-binding protein [Massarina eburnea CBS 473.64]|uniref:NAD(P)-binding protein n=1 Tax=Massarina eburnea CBS 473.64 TaxID=1395130 RepID=A0A6A6RMM6_9PLEO|nr:NAD(P)-binding protein [Massarina eburnea CBS 473.64]
MFQSFWKQSFPPPPAFLPNQIPPGSQTNRVYIITGANQGIGLELVKLLYQTGATIYLAGRSQPRIEAAIQTIKSSTPTPSTPATLKHLHLDLNDLTSIKASAATFAAQEKRLDILWNNAGVCGPPDVPSTKQGIEGHIGVNCIAPLLFTQALLPQLREATKSAVAGSVRVIWSGSLTIEQLAPKGGRIDYSALEAGRDGTIGSQHRSSGVNDYAVSKLGNWYLCVEAAERWGGNYGIVSVVVNPGNVRTNMSAEAKKKSLIVRGVLALMLYEPGLGAHTLLYAGFTGDVGVERNNGAYVLPFGVLGENGRKDVYEGIGKGEARRFWEWCERMYGTYV